MTPARFSAVALAVACLTFGPLAHAGDDVDQARALFNAGAQAYATGKYPAAIGAFKEAYRLSKRPGLLFSIAQAYRRQHVVDRDPENLRAAIDHYRRYLVAAPDGNRRADTVDALAQLEPLVAQLEERASESQGAVDEVTQLMVTSPTHEARLSLDGRDMGLLPYISEVEPGKRRIEITAPGYQPYARTIQVTKGSIVPLDPELQPKPASVMIAAPPGARVSLNGRYVGDAPLSALALQPGQYTLSIAKNGRELYTKELTLERDTWSNIKADPRFTTQRKVAWGTMAVGATAIVGAGVIGTIAFVRQHDATDIRDDRGEEELTGADLDRYRDASRDRDSFRTAALTTGGAGLALFSLGLVLYSFDQPRQRQEVLQDPTKPKPNSPPEAPGTMEVSLGMGLGGVVVRGRF